MINLKEIRTQINSIKTTRQVTGAMKMVSAARLKRAQDDISHIRPYTNRLATIIVDLKKSLGEKVVFSFSQPAASGKIVVLGVTSNKGLCGGFNGHVVKTIQHLLNNDLAAEFAKGQVVVDVIGKQGAKMLRSRGVHVNHEYNDLIHPSSFAKASVLANSMMDDFSKGEFKRVIIVYNEFVNTVAQEVKQFQYLPVSIPDYPDEQLSRTSYILEPDAISIIHSLIPKVLRTMLFQILLESQASEHGARMTAMHKATDNATQLISELRLSYNKVRQAAITNEILEITGGAEALSKR